MSVFARGDVANAMYLFVGDCICSWVYLLVDMLPMRLCRQCVGTVYQRVAKVLPMRVQRVGNVSLMCYQRGANVLLIVATGAAVVVAP